MNDSLLDRSEIVLIRSNHLELLVARRLLVTLRQLLYILSVAPSFVQFAFFISLRDLT